MKKTKTTTKTTTTSAKYITQSGHKIYVRKLLSDAIHFGGNIIYKKGRKRPITESFKDLEESRKLKPNETAIFYRTGEISNLTVIDVDNKLDTIEKWNKLIKTHGEIDTYKIDTPSGGYHYYFEYEEEIPTSVNIIENMNVDSRNNGGMIIGEYSYYNRNGEIVYYKKSSKSGNKIGKIPEWLKEMIVKREKRIVIKDKKEVIVKKVIKNKDSFEDIKIKNIENLLKIIPNEHAENYNKWTRICWSLHNYMKNNGLDKEKMKVLFINFSKRGYNYDEEECEKLWENAKDGPIEKRYLQKLAENYIDLLYMCSIHIDDVFTDLLLKDKKKITEDWTNIEINYEYLDEKVFDLDKYKTFVIKSPTGSGKTTVCKELFKKLENYRKMSIVSRKSMAYEQSRVFSFTNYLDVQNIFNATNQNIVVSIEQLKRTGEMIDFTNDVLILDEINNLIDHFNSSTIENKKLCWNKFCHLIRKAKYVIALDATMTDNSIYLINELRSNKKEILFIENLYQNRKGCEVDIYFSNKMNFTPKIIDIDYILLLKIFEHLHKKEIFIVCSDSKKLLEEIYNLCILYAQNNKINNKHFEILTSEITNKEHLKDCNKSFAGKVLFFTPTIVYGIDLQIPYVATYAFYQGKILSSLNILQQLGRGRKVKKMYISMHNYYKTGCKYNGQTYNDIDVQVKKELDKNEFNQKFEEEILAIMGVDNSIMADYNIYYPIYVRQKLYENYISKYVVEFLAKFLCSQGFDTRVHLNPEMNEEINIIKKDIKFILKPDQSIKSEYQKIIDNIFKTNKEIIEKIFIKEDITNELTVKVMEKINYLGIENYENFPEIIKEALYHDNKYKELFKKLYFTYSKSEIKNMYEHDNYKKLYENDKTIMKLKVLYEVEEELGIERLEIDKLNNGIDKNMKRNIIKYIERNEEKLNTEGNSVKEIYDKLEIAIYDKNKNYVKKTYPQYKKEINENMIKMKKLSENTIEKIIKNYEIFNSNKEHKNRILKLNKERKMQDIIYSLYKNFIENIVKNNHGKIEIKGMEEIVELKMWINNNEINKNLLTKYGENKTKYHKIYNKKEGKIKEISKLEDFEINSD